jgi:hypothetical protein
MKNNEKKDKKEFNISFSILRMYLCFVVVNDHLFKSKLKNIYLVKFLQNGISVPIFFIMSFFLCHKLFSLNDIIKIKLRLERLIIPYIFWPIIIWSFNNIFHFLLGMKMKISIYGLMIQILTGHYFVIVLWFQLNLIIITILLFFIHKLSYKNALYILINLLIISYFFQYSGINFKFLLNFHSTLDIHLEDLWKFFHFAFQDIFLDL